MRKKLRFILIVAALQMFAVSAFAVGICPDRSENLQAFARCMVPMRNGAGTVYAGTMADMDSADNQRVLAAVHGAAVVPPQVIPVGGLYPFYPYFPGAAMNMYFNSGTNPAVWGSWTVRYP